VRLVSQSSVHLPLLTVEGLRAIAFRAHYDPISRSAISLFSKRFFFSLTSKSPRDLSPSLAADDPIQNQRSPVIVFPLPRRPSPSSQLRSIITRIRFLSFNSDTKLPIIPNKRYEFQTLFSSFCLNSISKD
jgi:hypothetical protein